MIMDDKELFSLKDNGILSKEWAQKISDQYQYLLSKRVEGLNHHITKALTKEEKKEVALLENLLELFCSFENKIKESATAIDIYEDYKTLYRSVADACGYTVPEVYYFLKLPYPFHIWEKFLQENSVEYNEASNDDKSFFGKAQGVSFQINKTMRDIMDDNYYTLMALAMCRIFTRDDALYNYFMSIYSTETGECLFLEMKKWFIIRVTKEGKLYSNATAMLRNFCNNFQQDYSRWKKSKAEYAEFICAVLKEMRAILINMFKETSVWNSNYDVYRTLLKAEVD